MSNEARMTPAPESPDAALVKRLRQCADSIAPSPLHLACKEAATAITRLTAERDAARRGARGLRHALRMSANVLETLIDADKHQQLDNRMFAQAAKAAIKARAVLSAQERGNV